MEYDYKTIPEIFTKVCKKYPDKDLFRFKINGDIKSLSHAEIQEMVTNLSLSFLELGIRNYDRVAIVSENRIEWFVSFMALQCIGAIAVPIFPSSTSKQIEYICNDCETTAVIVSNRFQLNKIMEFKERLHFIRHVFVMNEDFQSDDFAVRNLASLQKRGKELRAKNQITNQLSEILTKINENDLSTLIYTSGTTGDPKGVMLTHKNIVSNVIDAIDFNGLNDSDTMLSYLPWCHAYEMSAGLMSGFTAGTTIALAESVETVGANLVDFKPTYLTTVPKLLEIVMRRLKAAMEKEKASKRKIFYWAAKVGKEYVYKRQQNKVSLKLKSQYLLADRLVFAKIREKMGGELKYIVSGGVPLSAETAEFFLAAGFYVIEGYGLTEASPIVCITDIHNIEVGTIGQPLPRVEIKLLDDGEMLVRGPNVMKGYWEDPAATNLAIDKDGWLYTGDIAVLTEKGNYKITDRKKNIFVNKGGKNIAPQPIENVLSQSPFIEQVILVGDNREYVTALITPDFTQLKVLAASLQINYEKPEELLSNEHIIKTIKNDIDRLQADFAKYERVRKFRLLSTPFTIENGELTPKLSIKRHVVERNYSFLIDEMYNVG